MVQDSGVLGLFRVEGPGFRLPLWAIGLELRGFQIPNSAVWGC